MLKTIKKCFRELKYIYIKKIGLPRTIKRMEKQGL